MGVVIRDGEIVREDAPATARQAAPAHHAPVQVALNTSHYQQLTVHWGCCPLVTRAYAAAARDPPTRRRSRRRGAGV